ncbi:hypothetical protein HNY73_009017 [Argiope bruennichi]|uniref:Uncharacterized protein n=1 Tax=Argiope bruennichi TaxID=94029 RepID=A0A8T0F889_ARGBR|nr:hypothetical protein HNY73_009017 [Argiope bruennichi]
MESHLATALCVLGAVNLVIAIVYCIMDRPCSSVVQFAIAFNLVIIFFVAATYIILSCIEHYNKPVSRGFKIYTYEDYFPKYEYRRYNQSDLLDIELLLNSSR